MLRAISYIGVPLAILFVHANNITDEAGIAAAAAPIGAAVGTIGTVLFYGTATMNLVWQHIGWKAVEEGNFKNSTQLTGFTLGSLTSSSLSFQQ